MISSMKMYGKFLDQPLLVSKFNSAVPKIFTAGALFVEYNEIKKAPENEKIKTAINTGSVLTATVISALAAPKIAPKIISKLFKKNAKNDETSKFIEKNILENNNNLVDSFLKSDISKNLSEKTKKILHKSKTQILQVSEIKHLDKELSTSKDKVNFFRKLIPDPENPKSEEILSEISRLSVFGAIPVLGGIVGGIAGEKLTTGKISKEKTADRVKEGAYQYLANIFLCNVGAAGALGILEKMNVKSKSARVLSMLTGILLTGVIGGSIIANYIGKKLINPIFGKDKNEDAGRKPELLDICLHTDDIATIAVMSGLRWIEPLLPVLYGISGFRSGIGYRNNIDGKETKTNLY